MYINQGKDRKTLGFSRLWTLIPWHLRTASTWLYFTVFQHYNSMIPMQNLFQINPQHVIDKLAVLLKEITAHPKWICWAMWPCQLFLSRILLGCVRKGLFYIWQWLSCKTPCPPALFGGCLFLAFTGPPQWSQLTVSSQRSSCWGVRAAVKHPAPTSSL